MTARRGGQFIQKHFGIPLEKSITTFDDGSIGVNGFFTSDKVDEVGDIITKDATIDALPKYRQWGNIRYMHMPKPVAKVLNIGKDDGLKWNEVEINVLDPEAIFQVKNGLLKALSVGIIIRSWEDIEIDEATGGWIINSYELAEISLVDHPANYDAKLFLDDNKIVPVGQEIRQLVSDHGFAMVSKALGTVMTPILEEEIDMAKLQKNLEAEAVVEEEEEVEEELEASIDEEEEEAGELEASVDDDEDIAEDEDLVVLVVENSEEVSAEEEDVVEEVLDDMDVRLEEEDPENDPDSILFDAAEADEEKDLDEDAEENSDQSEEEVIEGIVTEELAYSPELVRALADAILEALSKTETAEVPTEEQPEVEGTEEIAEDEITVLRGQVEALTASVAELSEKISKLTGVAPRKGLIKKSDALPHEDAEEMQESEEEPKSDLLKNALKKYIASPGRVQIQERR